MCPLELSFNVEGEEFSLKSENTKPSVWKNGRKLQLPVERSGVTFEIVGAWLFANVDGMGLHMKWNALVRFNMGDDCNQFFNGEFSGCHHH